MRIIDSETVREVLDMPTCIDLMEAAYQDQATGAGTSHPRQRYKVNGIDGAPDYLANMIAGALPRLGVAALRYDSMLVTERIVGGMRRREYHYPQGRSWGFVFLFSLKTGEPLACIQDFDLSPLRVGGTTGAAVRALAGPDASVVALFGSGKEARRNLEAICAVRPIKTVRVYSPNRDHREHFASEMRQSLNVDIFPVDDPTAALAGADIIMCATNSNEPVFDGTSLVPGQLVITLATSSMVQKRQEIDDTAVIRSQRIVVNHLAAVKENNQRELLDLLEDGRVPQSHVVELGDVLLDKTKGRLRADDIIYYKSNSGMGIQFAAAGVAVLRECEKRNLGHVVPTEWFGGDISKWLNAGFLPSS